VTGKIKMNKKRTGESLIKQTVNKMYQKCGSIPFEVFTRSMLTIVDEGAIEKHGGVFKNVDASCLW
jgi:hypothetical protein